MHKWVFASLCISSWSVCGMCCAVLCYVMHHPCNREEVVRVAIEQGTKLVQAVADALFSLPSRQDPDGPIVQLPAPTTKLPREKPVSSEFVNEFNWAIIGGLGD